MTVRYRTSGDEIEARKLLGEGRHQLSILRNAMSFQNLKQDQRQVRFDNGTVITCLSCFDQDVINIFVPPIGAEKGKRRRKRVEVQYLPAIEVYDGPSKSDTFMGVAICRGGGFEPPYEFVPKDYFPTDNNWEQPEELYKERHWQDYRMARSDEPRKFQDIIPKGINLMFYGTESSSTGDTTGGFSNIETRIGQYLANTSFCNFDHWCYCAASAPRWIYTTTTKNEYIYIFKIDTESGSVPITISDEFHINNDSVLNYDAFNCGVHGCTDIERCAVKKIKVGEIGGFPVFECVPDPTVTAETTVADSEAYVTQELIDTISGLYDDGTYAISMVKKPALSDSNYIYDYRKPLAFEGTAEDIGHYAFVYCLDTTEKYGNKAYQHSLAEIIECIDVFGLTKPGYCTDDYVSEDTETIYYGPLEVVVDDKTFEIEPRAPKVESPYLRRKHVKYFRLRPDSPNPTPIGMFFIGKNYYEPYDYMYIYVDIVNGQERIIKTPVDDKEHIIPGIKGMKDGVAVDLWGMGQFRLIRDERTIWEEGIWP